MHSPTPYDSEHSFIFHDYQLSSFSSDQILLSHKFRIHSTVDNTLRNRIRNFIKSKTEQNKKQSLIKSLLFGADGVFKILGHEVTFEQATSNRYSNALKGAGYLSDLAIFFQKSRTFRVLSGGSIQVLVHELGHATAHKLFTGHNSRILVVRNPCAGEVDSIQIEEDDDDDDTDYNPPPPLDNWKQSVFSYAGPMASVTFASIKLVAASALKYYCLPTAVFLATGAIMWMSGEVFYATLSAVKEDGGDFGKIRSNGNSHLLVASAALIGQCALGIFTAMMI